MTVATFAQPDFNVDDPTTYRTKLDGNTAVATAIIDNFAPHAVATPNMTVQLDAGAIPGVGVIPTTVALQTSGTLTAPTTNPRYDIVYIDVVTGIIGVATGTEAASPADPAIPSGKIPVARLSMTVAMASITNSIITDLRAPVFASGSSSVTAISTSTSITVGQNGSTFKLSGTGVTATLPTPVGNAGVRFRLFGSDANTQTIATPAATLNFPDASTVSSWGITNNQAIEIQSDGSVWRVLSMSGLQLGQTPATTDNTKKLANTEYVRNALLDSRTRLNKIINGNFGVNQRAVSGSVVLTAGSYGHDRWKAGAGGCTYTFATVNNVTTITISAGTLMQVIEGNNLQSGTHTLSWTGTAQARVDAGAYGAPGLTGTAVGGTNQTIEFGTGTVSLVQYEPGTYATPFEFRPYGAELELCKRYYQLTTINLGGYCSASTVRQSIPFPVEMRAAPTVATVTAGTSVNVAASSAENITAHSMGWYINATTTGNAYVTGQVSSLTAEL